MMEPAAALRQADRSPRRPALPPRLVSSAVMAVLAAGFAWTYCAGPTPPAWYPPCPLRTMTGLLCPGCGSARVWHDLAHGNLSAACGHNILIVCLLPIAAGWGAVALWRGLRHNLAPPAVPARAAIVLLAAIIMFTIARNLPWHPFAPPAP